MYRIDIYSILCLLYINKQKLSEMTESRKRDYVNFKSFPFERATRFDGIDNSCMVYSYAITMAFGTTAKTPYKITKPRSQHRFKAITIIIYSFIIIFFFANVLCVVSICLIQKYEIVTCLIYMLGRKRRYAGNFNIKLFIITLADSLCHFEFNNKNNNNKSRLT